MTHTFGQKSVRPLSAVPVPAYGPGGGALVRAARPGGPDENMVTTKAALTRSLAGLANIRP